MALISSINRFWDSHPALFYGLSFLLGFYFRFDWINSLLPIILLWLSSFLCMHIYYNRLILGLLLLTSTYFYGINTIQFALLPEEGITGTAHIAIQSLSFQKTFFGKKWTYQCRLRQFNAINESLPSSIYGVSCTISLPQKGKFNRPPANQSYVLQGKLIQTGRYQYILKVGKNTNWLPVEGSWSTAEWRYQAKQFITGWIGQKFSHARAATFLAGLVTGEFDDHLMQYEFSRFGLQHIMAISGFHFSILAAILGSLLRLWLPRKIASIVILTALTGYFLFLGCNSSIIRAWTMISIAMLGYCLDVRGQALNSLGVALFVVLLIDPLLSLTAGFQFSFLATAAILIGYFSMEILLCEILPKHPLSQMVEMNRWNQLGYCLLVWFRQGVALTIAINGLTWPLILYHFHQFPLMSLLYNLFFPFLVSLSMFLLLIGLVAEFLSSRLGQFIHHLNDFYTHWSLNLIYNIPQSVDAYYKVESVPKEVLVVYICGLLIGGIIAKSKIKKSVDQGTYPHSLMT